MKFNFFNIYFLPIICISFLKGQYDYSLEDLNSSSSTYGQNIGATFFQDHVTLHYFGHFTWGTCTSRFGQLNTLYENLKDQNYNIELIGIAKSSQSSASGNWTNSNNSPVCVDESPFDVWSDWGASQRDLFVLDTEGNLVLHQNITSGVPDNLENLILSLFEATGPNPCIIDSTYISEVFTSDNSENYIEIFNSSAYDCSLEGFNLYIEEEPNNFIFEELVILAGDFWLGYEGNASSFVFNIDSSGDEIWLVDSEGNSSMVSVGPSYELSDIQLSQSFQSDGIGCYTSPTPGDINSECVTLTSYNKDLVPKTIFLNQNYPNPFNPNTSINYELSISGNVILSVYDSRGRFVKSLFSGFKEQGAHTVTWNGKDDNGIKLSSGIYFYVLGFNGLSISKKLVMMQ